MTQQGVIRAVAQSQTHLADAARRRWPRRWRTVKLGDTFIPGKARGTKIALWHPLYAQQALLANRAEERQARTVMNIQQLVDHRGDERRFAAAAQASDGEAQMPVDAAVNEGVKLRFKSLHSHPVLP